MGASGYGFNLVAKDGAKSGLEVRQALIDFLSKAWSKALPEEHAEAATTWIDQGGDSLLMILVHEDEDPEGDWENDEPADQVLFLFEDSVQWGGELAMHWLAHAFVAGEETITKKLASLGYTRAEGGWHPKQDDLSKDRFLVDAERIGKPEEDGINWQLPEEDAGMTDYEELSEELQVSARKIRDGAPCQCAYCKKMA